MKNHTLHDKPPCILTVDDDRMTLAMLAIGMRKAGYDIMQAGSGEEALELIAKNRPDLAVLDISMPGMSGLELASRLREETTVPFMFLSSDTDCEIVRQAASNGAVGYLVKPIDPTQVIPAVEIALARAEEIRQLQRPRPILYAVPASHMDRPEDDRLRSQQREAELLTRYAELTELSMRLEQDAQEPAHGAMADKITEPLDDARVNIKALERDISDLVRILDAYAGTEAALTIDEQVCAELGRINSRLHLGFLRGDIASLVEQSKAGLQRVRKIVQDLKRLSCGNASDEWEYVDLHARLDAILHMAHQETGSKAVVLKEYGNIPAIECLPAQLDRAFMHIVVNAAQAMNDPSRGRIMVRTGCESDRVWVEVTDNGCGISPEHQAHVFDPFFTTKPAGNGTGIGLTMAYDIIRKHGGEIRLRSKVDEGTTFRVTLPCQQPD